MEEKRAKETGQTLLRKMKSPEPSNSMKSGLQKDLRSDSRLTEQEQNCWPPDLGVLLASVDFDFLSRRYVVRQLVKGEKNWNERKEPEGDYI